MRRAQIYPVPIRTVQPWKSLLYPISPPSIVSTWAVM